MPQRIDRIDGSVRITWPDGHVSQYSNRHFRLICPCAGCVEEMTGRPLLDPNRVDEDVSVTSIQLVGAYAIRPTFSGGHATGIYTFEMLRSLCPCPQCSGAGSGDRP